MMRKIILTFLIISALGETGYAAGRYISLAPSTTEILFALGLDEEIVGVSTYCDYPPAAIKKEKVGTFSQPNMERILLLKPDIVFCTGLEQAAVVTKLRQLNLKVFVSDPSSIEELLTSILNIGNLTNRQKEAALLLEGMESAIENIYSKTKSIPQDKMPKVLIEIWHSPFMTAGKGSLIDDLIHTAGGINIASDTKREYTYFSSEQIIKRNPDYIFLLYMYKRDPSRLVEERFGWDNVSAVKNNRVYADIDPNTLLRPGPRIIEGLKQLYKKLSPYYEQIPKN